jgi:cation transporter-like permease
MLEVSTMRDSEGKDDLQKGKADLNAEAEEALLTQKLARDVAVVQKLAENVATAQKLAGNLKASGMFQLIQSFNQSHAGSVLREMEHVLDELQAPTPLPPSFEQTPITPLPSPEWETVGKLNALISAEKATNLVLQQSLRQQQQQTLLTLIVLLIAGASLIVGLAALTCSIVLGG